MLGRSREKRWSAWRINLHRTRPTMWRGGRSMSDLVKCFDTGQSVQLAGSRSSLGRESGSGSVCVLIVAQATGGWPRVARICTWMPRPSFPFGLYSQRGVSSREGIRGGSGTRVNTAAVGNIRRIGWSKRAKVRRWIAMTVRRLERIRSRWHGKSAAMNIISPKP